MAIMIRIIFITVFSAVLITAGIAGADTCSEPVNTQSGKVAGTGDKETETCVWLGIPYGAPPVGDLRWRPTQIHPGWSGVRDAVDWGARCVQSGGISSQIDNDPSGRMSEDCLFMNVWRPDKSGTFPVMVWIHGGGYNNGTGNAHVYWGNRLSKAGDVVVVTFNYRLNVFGFFAHPALLDEDPNKSTGNQGSLDQVAAIKWVHDNIAGFGGDPNNVTIFGESAGGWSICTMMATPLNKGMFNRAILQSGGCETSEDLEDGYEKARAISQEMGCNHDDLDCMRNVPAKKLLKKTTGGLAQGFPFINHHDGHLLTGTPLSMIRSGDFNNVDFMAGFNRDEFSVALYLIPKLKNAKPDEYEEGLETLLGLDHEELDRMLELYPLSQYGNKPGKASAQIINDASLICPTYMGLSSAAARQEDTYLYRFDYDDMKLGKYIGAMHAMEIPFVFGNLDRRPMKLLYGRKNIGEAWKLSGIIQGYWINFARTGNPNGPGLPQWPAFETNDQNLQVLDTHTRTENAGLEERCGFWDEYNDNHPPILNNLGEVMK